MLLPRILTAVIGVPVILAAIHFGGVIYMAFTACVILLCLYEYGLVLTYEDWEKHEWRMLMPDCVREVLSANLPGLLTLVEKIGRVPSCKELRMMIMLDSFMHLTE